MALKVYNVRHTCGHTTSELINADGPFDLVAAKNAIAAEPCRKCARGTTEATPAPVVEPTVASVAERPSTLTMRQAADALNVNLLTITTLCERGRIPGAVLQEPAWQGKWIIPATSLNDPWVVEFAAARRARMNAELDQIERQREIENQPE